jgi:uncharacterized protein YndB with AHSA1/START domain
MPESLVAKASIVIDAPTTAVWSALVDPKALKQYMFGSTVISDWKKGSKIVFKGEWKGKPYEDKGAILQLDPGKRLQYTHFSPLAGKPDKPENYHTVTIELSADGKRTRVTLSQDNNATEEERDHSSKNWETMLAGLKKYVEKR